MNDFDEWADNHNLTETGKAETRGAWKAAANAERLKYLELLDYLAHDSWRCGYHGECQCGLNTMLESLGLDPVPLQEKKLT